jgi:hypothetical protein
MRIAALIMAIVGLGASGATAQPIAQQITVANTALLFGGADAEGGIGDWYLSNGVVQAVIDDAGLATDLTGIVAAGQEPPIQSQISPTGGTIVDLGRAGRDGDELPQLFTVGGLSTSNFILYDTVSAPAPGIVRASGHLLLPGFSDRPTPCVAIVTDYQAAGSDPFLTMTTTATNGCAGANDQFGGFLDAITWTLRGIIPFSAGAGLTGGRGFNHPVLDFASPAAALELPSFVGAPGILRAADGVMDPANGTVSSELAYGLLPVRVEKDLDGPGGAPAVVTVPANLLGVSSTLVTAMGILPVGADVPPGGTVQYVRRLYVGARADVRAVADDILPELAARHGFATGTLSGDVGAADTAELAASMVVTREGVCTTAPSTGCKANPDCGTTGPCVDPTPTTGFGPGGAVTHVRTDAAGVFSGVLVPHGRYELRVSAAERADVVVSGVTVGAGDTVVTVPPLSARGLVRFAVREKVRGRPTIPAKLVFKGVDGTTDPRFNYDLAATLGAADLRPETFGGTQRGADGSARGQANVVYTATGEGSIHVRPGTYDVYATRGPEYGLMRRRVTVTSAAPATVDFRLKRVIRTRDALAADFHVHSGRSLDSSAPLEDRVVSFASEGVEVMVSTDHDKHVDYTPIIAGLGLGARVATIPGVEITGSVPNPPAFPNSIGHINAWPVPVRKDDRRDGTIQDEYVAPNWVFSRLRAQAGADVVIQYNHPRAGVSGLTNIGFFNSIGCARCANAIDTACTVDADCPAGAGQDCTCVGFQPDRLLSAPPNDILLDTGVRGPGTGTNPSGIRNLDFDVMEVANGARAEDYASYRQVRDDWFALLGQGVWKPGTGVSDSHRLTVEHAGWSRTYVLGTGDDPAALDQSAFNASIKAGRMVVSAGPWITVTAKGQRSRGGPGEVVTGVVVRLKIDVHAPAWIPVDEVRIVSVRGLGQVSVRTFDATTRPRVKPGPANVESNGGTRRFHGAVTFKDNQDYLVLVEAGPKLSVSAPTSPDTVNLVEPDVVPLGFTNPIRIDADGGGFGLPRGAARLAPRGGGMTGVTRAARIEAARRGDYFPLHEFRIDPAAARALSTGRVP